MTGLEKIIDAIQKQAQAEADDIIAKAEQEAQKINDESQLKAENQKKDILKQAQETADGIANRSNSRAELQKKQELLLFKQKTISSILEEAKQKIVDLDDEKYLRFFEKTAKNVQLKGNAELFVNERDRKRLGEKLVKAFPDDLSVTLSTESADIMGGFIIKSDNFIINSSVEVLFDSYRDQLIEKIASRLFS